MGHQQNNGTPNPYLGLAIQSVSGSPNYSGVDKNQQQIPNNGGNMGGQFGNHQVASYANAIK